MCRNAVASHVHGMCNKHHKRMIAHGTTDDPVYKRVPDAVRFWAKVEKAGPDDCWHWKLKKGKDQYGMFRSTDLGEAMGAHRFSFFLANGFLPVETLHTCDVRSCVNPRHLVNGTRSSNMKDMVAKGRMKNAFCHKGSAHPAAKLTEGDVRAIRASTESLRALGLKYDLTYSHISSIRRRKTWKHLD